MSKLKWADMTDDDMEELAVPVTISKHGVKIKKAAAPPVYVPPHLRQDKTKPPVHDRNESL
jgi:hypothetical protein